MKKGPCFGPNFGLKTGTFEVPILRAENCTQKLPANLVNQTVSGPRNEKEMLSPTVKIEVQKIIIGRLCQVCAFHPCIRLRIDVFKN